MHLEIKHTIHIGISTSKPILTKNVKFKIVGIQIRKKQLMNILRKRFNQNVYIS